MNSIKCCMWKSLIDLQTFTSGTLNHVMVRITDITIRDGWGFIPNFLWRYWNRKANSLTFDNTLKTFRFGIKRWIRDNRLQKHGTFCLNWTIVQMIKKRVSPIFRTITPFRSSTCICVSVNRSELLGSEWCFCDTIQDRNNIILMMWNYIIIVWEYSG